MTIGVRIDLIVEGLFTRESVLVISINVLVFIFVEFQSDLISTRSPRDSFIPDFALEHRKRALSRVLKRIMGAEQYRSEACPWYLTDIFEPVPKIVIPITILSIIKKEVSLAIWFVGFRKADAFLEW